MGCEVGWGRFVGLFCDTVVVLAVLNYVIVRWVIGDGFVGEELGGWLGAELGDVRRGEGGYCGREVGR